MKLTYEEIDNIIVKNKYPDLSKISNSDVESINIFKVITKKCANNSYNDCIASMKIGRSVYVELYSGKRYKGRVDTYPEVSNKLDISSLNHPDTVSSVKLCPKSKYEKAGSC